MEWCVAEDGKDGTLIETYADEDAQVDVTVTVTVTIIGTVVVTMILTLLQAKHMENLGKVGAGWSGAEVGRRTAPVVDGVYRSGSDPDAV